ncbi:MAG: DUF1476 domain-containing protein [Rhodospirillaceae bacterium]|nr:DUF1476 domain-containing protein [Rhodospirillaceae bacterium]
MSDAFKDREKGFERKYQLDQEQQFRVQSRRDKLFGLWAAGKLGKSGDAAEAYAKEVVAANFDKPGDDDMFAKVDKDLKAANVAVSDQDLRAQLHVAYDRAAQQILSESPKK